MLSCAHMLQRIDQLRVNSRNDLGAADGSNNEIRRSNIVIQRFPRIERPGFHTVVDGVSPIHPHDAGGIDIGTKVCDSQRLGLVYIYGMKWHMPWAHGGVGRCTRWAAVVV